MDYPRYSEMKDSGIEWLGEVPTRWNIKRMDGFLKYEKKSVTKKELNSKEVFHYSIPNFDEIEDGKYEEGEEINSNKYLIKGNELLVSKLNPRKRRVILTESKEVPIVCSTEFVPLKINEGNKKFYYYFYKSHFATERIVSTVQSATNSHKRANPSDIIKLWTAFPPLKEQKLIVDFLDQKTERVDKLIEKKEKLIELLEEKRQAMISETVIKGLDPNVPMKDFGIDWLGEIPDHWDRLPIKRVVSRKITDGPHESPDLVEEGIPFISAEAIKNYSIDFDLKRGYITEELYKKYSKKCKPQKRDVLFVKSGASTGNIAIVNTEADFSIWSPLAIIRADEDILYYKYLFYSLLSKEFQRQVELFWSYGTQENIGMGVIEDLKIPIPPLNEQYEIVTFLEGQVTKINNLIKKTKRQISNLKEYRKTLISKAVTGKIDVRELA